MGISQAMGARLAGLIGVALTAAWVPTAARAADLALLCGFDTSFGDGPETTFPRRSESRVLIDLEKRTVRFTSPGSGQLLVPIDASISDTHIRWTMGKPDGVQMSYSIDRASATYTVRFTVQGTAQQGGTRGSCLPKTPF